MRLYICFVTDSLRLESYDYATFLPTLLISLKSKISNPTFCNQITTLQDELDAKNREMKKFSRQIDELEEENEQMRSKLGAEKADVEDSQESSKDEVVLRLENSVRNHEMRQNHSKIAMANLEKSISTYHEKIELIEGAGIIFISSRSKLSD